MRRPIGDPPHSFNYLHFIRGFMPMVLPLVYDDSISMLEMVEKVKYKINQLVENNNNLPDLVEALIKEMLNDETFGEIIADYVNNLFLNVTVPPTGIPAAKGDGSTDDHDAIQGVIDWAAENGGGLIHIPKGTYLTSPLTMKSNVAIVGEDRYLTKIVAIGGSTTSLINGEAENFTLANLTLDGNKDVQSTKFPNITLTGTRWHLHDLIITNGYAGAVFNTTAGHVQIDRLIYEKCTVFHAQILGEGTVQSNDCIYEDLNEEYGQTSLTIGVDHGTFTFNSWGFARLALAITGHYNHIVCEIGENFVDDYTADQMSYNDLTIYHRESHKYFEKIAELEAGTIDYLANAAISFVSKNSYSLNAESYIEVVGQDFSSSVGGDREEQTTGDAVYNFAQNLHETVGGNVRTLTQGTTIDTYVGEVTENYQNNYTENVDENKNINVSKTLTEIIEGEAVYNYKDGNKINVTGDRTLNITGESIECVGEDKNIEIKGNLTETVSGDATYHYNGNQIVNVTGDSVECIVGNKHLTTDGNLNEDVGKNYTQNVTGDAAHLYHANASKTVFGNEINVNLGTFTGNYQDTDLAYHNYKSNITGTSIRYFTGTSVQNYNGNSIINIKKALNETFGAQSTTVKGNYTLDVDGTKTESAHTNIEGYYESDITTSGDASETYGGNHTVTTVGKEIHNYGDYEVNFDGNVTLHAKKDLDVIVDGQYTEMANNDKLETYSNLTTTVKGESRETVENGKVESYNAQSVIVSGNKTETVDGTKTEKYGVLSQTVNGNYSETVGGNKTENYETLSTGVEGQTLFATDSYNETVIHNKTEIVNGNSTETVAGDKSVNVKNLTETITETKTVKAAGINETVTNGHNLTAGSQSVDITGNAELNYGSRSATITGTDHVGAAEQTVVVTGDQSIQVNEQHLTVADDRETVIGKNDNLDIKGDWTVSAESSMETISNAKVIQANDINLKSTNPLTYKTPVEIGSGYKGVPFKDEEGNVYNVLTTAGVVPQPPEQKYQPINVLEYGLHRDGKTPNDDAFNALLQQGYDAFIFPSGGYIFQSKVTLNNIGLYGYNKPQLIAPSFEFNNVYATNVRFENTDEGIACIHCVKSRCDFIHCDIVGMAGCVYITDIELNLTSGYYTVKTNNSPLFYGTGTVSIIGGYASTMAPNGICFLIGSLGNNGRASVMGLEVYNIGLTYLSENTQHGCELNFVNIELSSGSMKNAVISVQMTEEQLITTSINVINIRYSATNGQPIVYSENQYQASIVNIENAYIQSTGYILSVVSNTVNRASGNIRISGHIQGTPTDSYISIVGSNVRNIIFDMQSYTTKDALLPFNVDSGSRLVAKNEISKAFITGYVSGNYVLTSTHHNLIITKVSTGTSTITFPLWFAVYELLLTVNASPQGSSLPVTISYSYDSPGKYVVYTKRGTEWIDIGYSFMAVGEQYTYTGILGRSIDALQEM